MNCRFCKKVLQHEFVDLINSPASNSFLSREQLNEPEVYYPLKAWVCDKCFLVQIDEYKSSGSIFNNEYVYFSSYSRTWLNHARRYVEDMITRFNLGVASNVVEIASNDGYLLQYFVERQIPVIGIEPTENTATVAIQKGVHTITDFFGTRLAKKLAAENKMADLLLGNNVLAHVPDIVDFVSGMKILLKSEGIITMEFPHLTKLVDQNQFDTIYHEHYSYLSLYSVQKIFAAQYLEIFDVQELPTHGGSLRIYAKHTENKERPVSQRVVDLLESELRKGINSLLYYTNFQNRIHHVKLNLTAFLVEQSRTGRKVAAYGAAAKGNALLNFCGIRKDLIDFVVDANTAKQNKYLPGSHIPVVEEKFIKDKRPDYVIILPWNIKEEVMEQLAYITEWDGKFVIPTPELQIL